MEECCFGLLAGFQSATLWTQQKPICMAQGKAATEPLAVAFPFREIVLLLGIDATNDMEIYLGGGRLV